MREHRIRSAALFMMTYILASGVTSIVFAYVVDEEMGWQLLWLIFAFLGFPLAIVGVFATWAAPVGGARFRGAFVVNVAISAFCPVIPLMMGPTGLGLGAGYALGLTLLFASAALFSGIRSLGDNRS